MQKKKPAPPRRSKPGPSRPPSRPEGSLLQALNRAQPNQGPQRPGCKG